jgi:hypothetical protein
LFFLCYYIVSIKVKSFGLVTGDVIYVHFLPLTLWKNRYEVCSDVDTIYRYLGEIKRVGGGGEGGGGGVFKLAAAARDETDVIIGTLSIGKFHLSRHN